MSFCSLSLILTKNAFKLLSGFSLVNNSKRHYNKYFKSFFKKLQKQKKTNLNHRLFFIQFPLGELMVERKPNLLTLLMGIYKLTCWLMELL